MPWSSLPGEMIDFVERCEATEYIRFRMITHPEKIKISGFGSNLHKEI